MAHHRDAPGRRARRGWAPWCTLRSGGGSDVPCAGAQPAAALRSSSTSSPTSSTRWPTCPPSCSSRHRAGRRALSCWATTSRAIARCSSMTAVRSTHRPRACRIYDCRVFPAAGVTPDKPLIAERAGAGSSRIGTATRRSSTRRCAPPPASSRTARTWCPATAVPSTCAVLAVELRDLFLDPDRPPAPSAVRVKLGRRRLR